MKSENGREEEEEEEEVSPFLLSLSWFLVNSGGKVTDVCAQQSESSFACRACVYTEGITVSLWYYRIHANIWDKWAEADGGRESALSFSLSSLSVLPVAKTSPPHSLPLFLFDCRSLCWSSASPSYVGSEAVWVRWRRINTSISTSVSLSLFFSLSPATSSSSAQYISLLHPWHLDHVLHLGCGS